MTPHSIEGDCFMALLDSLAPIDSSTGLHSPICSYRNWQRRRERERERERERKFVKVGVTSNFISLSDPSLPPFLQLQLGGLFNSPLLVSRRGAARRGHVFRFDEPRRLIAPPGIHFHSVFSGYSAAAEARLRNFGHIVRVKHGFLNRLLPLTQREPHVDDR